MLNSQFQQRTATSLKPPLKWAGGKRWQVPDVRRIWEPHAHRRLIEPFCGGLAIALALEPTHALLNDANPHLINFYRWLQRGLRIELTMENREELFYASRDRFNTLLSHGQDDGVEAAGLFYYLNRTGFNGLCRFNQSGLFNVPFGRYARIRYTKDFSDTAMRWRAGRSRARTSSRCRSTTKTSSMRIRRMTWSSRSTRARDSRGPIRSARPSGSRTIVDQSCSSTRRRGASKRSIESSAIVCDSSRRLAGSTTRAIGRRRAKSWPRATFEIEA